KTVRIDCIRSTGKKSYQISSVDHAQKVKGVRIYSIDLIYLISQYLIEYMNIENISGLKLVQVCKKLCRWKSSVRTDDRVSISPPDRKTGSLQMSCSLLQ